MKERATKRSRRDDQLPNLISRHSSNARPTGRVFRSPFTPTVSGPAESPAKSCCDSATKKWRRQHVTMAIRPQFEVRKSNASNEATALAWRNPPSQHLKHVPIVHHRSGQSVCKVMCYCHCVTECVPSATNDRICASVATVPDRRTDKNLPAVLTPRTLAERSSLPLFTHLLKIFTHFLS